MRDTRVLAWVYDMFRLKNKAAKDDQLRITYEKVVNVFVLYVYTEYDNFVLLEPVILWGECGVLGANGL